MIRRALAFVGVGPLITYMTVRLAMDFPSLTAIRSEELLVVMLSYAIGFVPALALAGIDQAFEDRRLRYRPIWTGVCAV
ncbi:MAG: hypothetical protein EOO82_02730, partial [Oxalobacteraceae bacterium]